MKRKTVESKELQCFEAERRTVLFDVVLLFLKEIVWGKKEVLMFWGKYGKPKPKRRLPDVEMNK